LDKIEHKKRLIAFAGLSNIRSTIVSCETYKDLCNSRDLVKVLEDIKKKCDEAITKVNNEGI
jgi:hypothetical protein